MPRKGRKEEGSSGDAPKINRLRSIAPNKHDKMLKILENLRKKIDELEDIRKDISRPPAKSISPSQARAMIEEIKVPSLELIDAKPKKHSQVSSA